VVVQFNWSQVLGTRTDEVPVSEHKIVEYKPRTLLPEEREGNAFIKYCTQALILMNSAVAPGGVDTRSAHLTL
jgi:hypothetical protein